MKDAFKIKKGLNVQPIDPADVVNPEAGDIIVDSTDDNRMKVYDPTAGEFSLTGNSADNVTYDNTLSGLSSTEVQSAIDEIESRIDVVESNPNNNITALDIDWSLKGVYYKDISTDTIFTFSNDNNGQTILIIINNTDVNVHSVTFPVGIKTDPNYSGNVEPNTESIFTLVKSNGSIYIAEVKELS